MAQIKGLLKKGNEKGILVRKKNDKILTAINNIFFKEFNKIGVKNGKSTSKIKSKTTKL